MDIFVHFGRARTYACTILWDAIEYGRQIICSFIHGNCNLQFIEISTFSRSCCMVISLNNQLSVCYAFRLFLCCCFYLLKLLTVPHSILFVAQLQFNDSICVDFLCVCSVQIHTINVGLFFLGNLHSENIPGPGEGMNWIESNVPCCYAAHKCLLYKVKIANFWSA